MSIKPTFAPLALVGARKRSWWVALVPAGVFVLLTLPEWFRYVQAIRDVSNLGLDYSLGALPLVLLPLVTLAARQAR